MWKCQQFPFYQFLQSSLNGDRVSVFVALKLRHMSEQQPGGGGTASQAAAGHGGAEQQPPRNAPPPPPPLPVSDRDQVACRTCHLILTRTQFATEGCRNCGYGPLKPSALTDRVTTNFSGFVGLVDAPNSWLARVIRRTDAPVGIYAAEAEAPVGVDDEDDFDDDDEADAN